MGTCLLSDPFLGCMADIVTSPCYVGSNWFWLSFALQTGEAKMLSTCRCNFGSLRSSVLLTLPWFQGSLPCNFVMLCHGTAMHFHDRSMSVHVFHGITFSYAICNRCLGHLLMPSFVKLVCKVEMAQL